MAGTTKKGWKISIDSIDRSPEDGVGTGGFRGVRSGRSFQRAFSSLVCAHNARDVLNSFNVFIDTTTR